MQDLLNPIIRELALIRAPDWWMISASVIAGMLCIVLVWKNKILLAFLLPPAVGLAIQLTHDLIRYGEQRKELTSVMIAPLVFVAAYILIGTLRGRIDWSLRGGRGAAARIIRRGSHSGGPDRSSD